MGALVLPLSISAPTAAVAASTARFSSVALSAPQEEMLGDDIALLVGAAYGAVVAPTTVETTIGPDETVATDDSLPVVEAADVAVEEVAEVVPLTDQAKEQVQAMAEDLAPILDPAEAAARDEVETVAVEVAPAVIEATKDNQTGELLLEATTEVTSQYDSGVESVELVETLVVVDPVTGEITSFDQIDLEDYANAATFDSNAVPAPEEGITSEDGAPLDLSTPSDASDPAVTGGAGGGVARAVSRPIIMGLSAANKQKVVDYALKYAINRNTAYRDFTSSGGDCTNFVSQSMRAGGWKDDIGLFTDNHNWWYNSLNQTRSWAGAENWYQFARVYSKRAGVLTNLNSVVPGDVIQIKFSGRSAIGHSMVVTRKDSNGTIYVSYHTNNTKNKKLSDVMNAYSGETYFAHRI